MDTLRSLSWIWLAVAISAGVPPARAQITAPNPAQNIGIDQRLGEQVPLSLVFHDEEGREVALQDYFGNHPVVLTLVYYECPMLCTQVLNGLVSSLRMLSFTPGREFEIVTVSFNPKEGPELARAKKQEYLKTYGHPEAAAGWHFLTGTQDQIDRLTQAVGFRYRYDSQSGQYIHASGIVVLTPQGQLARYFYGIEYSPKDLRLGLVEAAAGRIGSAVDQLLLLCYHYDPKTGKYGVVINTTLQLAGLATVVALGSFVAVLLRRERQQQTAVSREPPIL